MTTSAAGSNATCMTARSSASFALLLAARLAKTQSGTAPSVSTQSGLHQVEVELQRAIDEFRDIAHGIHPTVLTDEGLAAAVDYLADSTMLQVGPMPDGRFAAPVENATYRVIAESVANQSDASRSRANAGPCW